MALTTVQTAMQGSPQYYSFKNRIINGAMVIDQRNNGASVTPTTDVTYTVDRWMARLTQSSKYSVQQVADAPAGFYDSLKFTSLSSYSVGSTDFFGVGQAVEACNVVDLGWGTSSAQAVTASFWVKSSLTGTFGGTMFAYQSGIPSYPFSYTIPVANTWTKISIPIPGATSGTFYAGMNSGYLFFEFSIGTGSSLQGTANTWNYSTLYRSVSGETSVVGTNGATFYITGVQLEVGSSATSFDYRPYGTEFSLCERYFEVLNVPVSFPFACVSYANGATGVGLWRHRTLKRATPTVTFNASSNTGRLVFPSNIGGSAGGMQSQFQQADSVQISSTTTLTAGAGWIDTFIAYSSAEL